MAIRLNHTVVLARNKAEGAAFLAHILGLKVGAPVGPFVPVTTANGVTLDFYTVENHTERFAHYAFLVSEPEFDACLARLHAQGVTHYATPHLDRPHEINRHDGGRGLYFLDPTGNTMELITVPYGGWSDRDPG